MSIYILFMIFNASIGYRPVKFIRNAAWCKMVWMKRKLGYLVESRQLFSIKKHKMTATKNFYTILGLTISFMTFYGSKVSPGKMIILIIFVAERDKNWIWRELTSQFAVKAQRCYIYDFLLLQNVVLQNNLTIFLFGCQ